MKQQDKIHLFEDKNVRTVWNESNEKWYFSIVDIIEVLTESKDSSAYWRKLKQRLKQEGNETVTNCHGLKMEAIDGEMRLTDVADTEQRYTLDFLGTWEQINNPDLKVVEFDHFKSHSTNAYIAALR